MAALRDVGAVSAAAEAVKRMPHIAAARVPEQVLIRRDHPTG